MENKDSKYIAIIPARKGSKSLKRKNLIKLNKIRLIEYTFLSAQESFFLKKIYLTTDDNQIKTLAKKYKKILIISRQKKLCGDNALMKDVVLDVIKKKILHKDLNSTNIVLLQPTSPLRSSKDIDKAISLFKKNKKKNNLISVSEPINHPCEMININNKKITLSIKRKKQMNRQQYKKFYFINGSIFIFNALNFLKTKKFITKTSLIFKMEKKHSIDLNNNFDIQLIKNFL